MFGRRFRTAIAALLGTALVVSVVQTLPASADTALTTPLQVNFQAQTSATPSGYLADYGQAYDATRGYGWVTTGAGTPLNLVGNGRTRGVSSNPLLDSFMQMQLASAASGVHTAGAWKASVPNGTYTVTVAVGDPSFTDSEDVISVEGTQIIDFKPTTANSSQVVTATVNVADGFLNVSPVGGTNTKIDYIQVNQSSSTAPYVQSSTPSNGQTGVTIDSAVTLVLSNGVNPNTVGANSIQLFDASNNQVAGHYNVDGAYAAATFQPSAQLAENASYTIKTTTALQDPSGNAYTPYTATFTTGSTTATGGAAGVNFNTSLFDYSDGTSKTTTAYSTQGPTAMALGPNPAAPTQLYVAVSSGAILVYNLDPNTGQKVGAPTAINTFKLNRIVSGITFDPTSTASNIKLWVSNGQFGCDLAALGVACDDFTGAVSELTGTSVASLAKTDVVTGLPRSVGNHMNNGLQFGPDGNIYMAQAAENGYGSPDAIWGNRAEDALSASILKINQTSIISGGKAPYNVSSDTSLANPYNYKAAGALVTPYVTGIRNPFTVLWDSNGKLYAPVNESSNGNAPATTTNQAALTDLPAFDDYFTQVVAGKFYGHPNPARGENYVLNGGNPTSGTDPFEVPQYPVGTQPNANWRQPDLDLGLHRSADGSTEYKSNVFGSSLQGQILVSEYSQGKDILAIKLDSSGNAVSKTVVASGFYNPLPLVSDPSSGRVYVGEYGHDPDGAGGQISLLTPNTGAVTPPTTNSSLHIDFGAATTTPVAGYTLDDGAAYNTTSGFGWENNSTSTPLSYVGNGRERNMNSNKLLDTFMQMQAVSGAGNTTPGKWVANVANGQYTVTVGVGDPSYTDSHDVLNAEGTPIVDFTPSSANTETVVTATVTVSDGQLTIDPTGGTNTKIAYIDVVPVGGASATPTVTVTPSGTQDANGGYVSSATVTISASETGGTIASTTYTVDGGAAQNYTAPFSVSTVGSHTVAATTTDGNGTKATASSTFAVDAPAGTGTGTTLNVNFGAATTAAISGYQLDDGGAFSTAAGFGWENAANAAPLSFVGNGRERNVNSNKLMDTFMQSQLASASSGNHTAGAWAAVVANGTYTVTLGIGDPSYTDSHDVVNANGAKIVDFTPTSAKPQTVVTATVTITNGLLTLDPTGGTNLKIDYVTIVPQGSGGGTPPTPSTPPTVTAAVNGTTNTAGNYLDTATVVLTAKAGASDAGSAVQSTNYTLDGGAKLTYTAPFQVSTAGSHTVVATATDVSGDVSTAVTKTFVIVASSGGQPTPASLKVTSPEDSLGLGSRLVFSTVKNESRAGHAATLTNTGTGTLNVTSLVVTKNFQLCSGQATAFSIAPNATATVCVQYRPTVDAPGTNQTVTDQGTLTINSNDASVPSYVVTLGGLNARNYESYYEPSLQQIFDALGYTDNVVVTNHPQPNSISSSSAAVGDEILSPYFKALNTSKAVSLIPLAHYSGKDTANAPSVGYYAKGSPGSMNYLYSLPGGNSSGGANDGYGQNQLLLPTTTTGSSGINSTTFKPTGSFGIGENFPGYSSKSDDTLNGGGWHNLRFYPAKDANGNVIPGEYLVGDDVGPPVDNSAKNWDYQDYSWLLTNATPDTSVVLPPEGVQDQALASFPGNAGGIDGSGFTTAQGTVTTSKIAYAAGQLQITASNDSNTSHTNALQLGVSAGDLFRIQSRLVGPFTSLNAGQDQEGIYFGPNSSNYIKAEVEWNPTAKARYLTIWKETTDSKGVASGNILNSVVLPSGDASTIDFRIDVDPSPQDSAHYGKDPLVHISYALNGGGFTSLNPSADVNIPGSWITSNTPAGIVTSDQTGSSLAPVAFVATFASFSIARNF